MIVTDFLRLFSYRSCWDAAHPPYTPRRAPTGSFLPSPAWSGWCCSGPDRHRWGRTWTCLRTALKAWTSAVRPVTVILSKTAVRLVIVILSKTADRYCRFPSMEHLTTDDMKWTMALFRQAKLGLQSPFFHLTSNLTDRTNDNKNVQLKIKQISKY